MPTLTESEVKAREEIKEGISSHLHQAQNKMGIIWGQIGSGYQWHKGNSDVWKDLNIIVSYFTGTLKYFQ